MKKIQYFVDFDSTITKTDVGIALSERFGPCDLSGVINDWLLGKATSREPMIQQWASIKAAKKEMVQYLETIEIDPYFSDFYSFVKKSNASLTILSDGVDFYIHHILRRFHLEDIPVFSNRLVFTSENEYHLSFPYFEHSCGKCANCKGYHIPNLTPEGYKVVYIGDGYSDICAVPVSDYIFAKKCLLDYCIKNEIKCYKYSDFKEVLTVLTDSIV